MEKDTKEFLQVTSKKLAKIEKKIQEMKLNIVIMSFYSDLKLIEDALLNYQSQGIMVNESLFEKIEKFKILLQSNQNLPKIGRKFIELTEEFYKLRKQLYHGDKLDVVQETEDEIPKQVKKSVEDYFNAYA